jgi:hypothetical protein
LGESRGELPAAEQRLRRSDDIVPLVAANGMATDDAYD